MALLQAFTKSKSASARSRVWLISNLLDARRNGKITLVTCIGVCSEAIRASQAYQKSRRTTFLASDATLHAIEI